MLSSGVTGFVGCLIWGNHKVLKSLQIMIFFIVKSGNFLSFCVGENKVVETGGGGNPSVYWCK